MASLFPTELDLGAITGQVEQLALLLSEVAAERYVSGATIWILVTHNHPTDTLSLCGSCLPISDAKWA